MSDMRTRFSIDIEKLKGNSPDISYIDIIVEYCEPREIDLTQVPKFLTPTLKQKITRECKNVRLIFDQADHFSMDDFI